MAAETVETVKSSSLKVEILQKNTSISAKLNEKTLTTCKYFAFPVFLRFLDHFCAVLIDFRFLASSDPPPKPLATNQPSTIVPTLRELATNHQHQHLESCKSTLVTTSLFSREGGCSAGPGPAERRCATMIHALVTSARPRSSHAMMDCADQRIEVTRRGTLS